ncbi:MAG: peptidyl-prolyl cis-trans isomerase [Candidatus Paceibacterota bacterium]
MKLQGIKIGLLLIIFSALISCDTDNENYVASIEGNYEISRHELLERYKNGYYGLRFPKSEHKGYEKALDYLILKKLKQVDFFDKELHKDQDLISDMQRVINEEILVIYFETQYLGQYITDEVIKDYYDGLGRRLTYQQIVFNKSNTDNIEFLKNLANRLKEEAESTGNFTELVRENSEDSASRARDGRMPTMTWRQGTSSPKNQIIFRMPEGTIRVIETARFIYVIKVNKVEEVELPPLEETRPNIVNMLTQVYGPRAYDDYDRDKANLLNKDQYEWNEEGLNQLVEWSNIDRFYFDDNYKPIIEEHLANGGNFEILNYENGTVDLKKYYYLLNNILLIETTTNTSKEDFKEFIDDALRTELIVEKGKELGLDENILSVNSDSDVLLEEFVRLYDREFITSKIPEQTTENYEAFHEITKDSLFYQPDKVNLHVKIYDTEEEAQKDMEKIKSGNKFEELFRAWKVKTYYINKEGNTDSYLSNEPNYFGDEAFKLSEGETAGPIKFEQNQETKYAIIKAHIVLQEKILTLDEIQPAKLKRMFRNYYWTKFNNEVSENLREKYTVEINESALVELSGSN